MAAKKGERKVKTLAEKSAVQKVKADNFVKLARKRVPKALKAISLIGNLAGSGYVYTQEQVNKIEAALTKAVESVMLRFVPGSKEQQAQFDI